MDTNELAHSLPTALATVPDPRSAQGKRHPLPAILTLAVCAMLAGARSLYAICQWGRQQDPDAVSALGFTRPLTPAVSTLHAVFCRLDTDAFAAAIAQWTQQWLSATGERVVIAVDGKALRGIHGEELPGVRLVAGYVHGAGLVVGQKGVRPGAGELTAARALTTLLPVAGNTLTGDALYCQRDYCQQIRDAGGNYPVIVKKNQQELYDDIALAFAEPVWAGRYRKATTCNRHGDRWEIRQLQATDALNDYLDWPEVGQVCRITRRVPGPAKTPPAVRYGITSLDGRVGPAALLRCVRGHAIGELKIGCTTCGM